MSLKTIATHLELPSSSTAALLKCLSDLDYLSYDVETRTYLPTLKLAALGDWVPKRIMADGVSDLVGRLRERTQETIVVTALNDLYVEYIDFKVSHQYAGTYCIDENLRFPSGAVVVTCPMAWYLLKQYTVARLERIYHRSKAKRLFDARALTWKMFLNRLESARQSKYIVATRWPYQSSAVLVTTVPVLPFGRHVALGVGASIERMRTDLPALLDLIDSELAQLPTIDDTLVTAGKETQRRVMEIDALPGFLTP